MKIVPGEVISSQFAAMSIDWEVSGGKHADGLLTRGELLTYIDELELQRPEASKQGEFELNVLDMNLRDARNLLGAMKAVDADAIDYLPERLEGFPEHLRTLAAEILMKDDADAGGEIDQFILDLARLRYEKIDADNPKRVISLRYIDELAGKLGLR